MPAVPFEVGELSPSTRGQNASLHPLWLRQGDEPYGLAQEHWGVFDALAMMQQLGAIPERSPA